MFVGPIFTREAIVAPRRVRHYIMRTVYAVSLLLLICTAWMILAGTQNIRNIGDMARFGAILFQILAPLQLAVILFLSSIQAASNISVEKDRQTLILLLMTRLSNSELVFGKLASSLLNIGVMLMISVPILMLIVLFGGTSFHQVGWTVAVTAMTGIAAGAIGATIALWREKTFQTLALVALCLFAWLGLAEGIALIRGTIAGVDSALAAGAISPVRAIFAASRPESRCELVYGSPAVSGVCCRPVNVHLRHCHIAGAEMESQSRCQAGSAGRILPGRGHVHRRSPTARY